KVITSLNEGIQLENVHFSYGDKEVLKGINLTVPKGKTVALVGPSGGGKSTLVDLIPRFLDVSDGHVLFDGIDVRTLRADSLRQLIGLVNQESVLFNDTIFNNIAFATPDAT